MNFFQTIAGGERDRAKDILKTFSNLGLKNLKNFDRTFLIVSLRIADLIH